MSQPTIRLMVLENGSEAMSLDIAFDEMKGCLDGYFFCAEKLLGQDEYDSFVKDVQVWLAQRIARKGRLQ